MEALAIRTISHWHPQHVLMQAHAFANEPAATIADDGFAEFAGGNHSETDELPGGSSCQFRTKQPLASLWPCCLRRAKSARCRSRMARVSLSRAGGFMLDGCQPSPALLPAALEDGLAALVAIRLRKPCLRARFKFDGWNVRFMKSA